MTPREEFDHLRALQRETLLFEWSDEAPPGSSYYIRRRMIRRMAVLAVVLFTTVSAAAHDSWISRGGLRNSVGEWCCGDGDCAVMDDGAVSEVTGGYRFKGVGRIGSGPGQVVQTYDEVIPYSEVMPIAPDGRWWRCKRPDHTRRCVFGPPPGS